MKTEEQLLAAPLSDLSAEELSRRSLMINIRKSEREAEMVEHQNEQFRTAKDERVRMRQIGVENAELERAKVMEQQLGCAHKTGGEGLAGIFSGDGSIYGSSTTLLVLPTGEQYVLCFRCQKEWHRPSKRAVVEGKMSLDEYKRLEREYVDACRWPRKSFAPVNGEPCAASLFNLPALRAREAKDNVDFANYVARASA